MLRCKVDEEEHQRIYGGLREEIGMNTYLHGPMDAAKNLKLRFRVGDLDLPEKKKIYQQSRGGRRCTEVPLWQSNGEQNPYSGGM